MKVEGILVEFDSPAALMHAAESMRDAGYKKFDCHSPFPIHGMDEAMGLKRSPLGWIVGIAAISAGGLGVLMQWWMNAVDYKLVISGKPFFSYPAFLPVTFGLAVLIGALTAFIGMLALNKLPMLYHPVFHSENFGKFSNDGFFISVLSNDPQYDEGKVTQIFNENGGKNIELLKANA